MLAVKDVKARVRISEILDSQGIQHNRNRCACPIHDGSNPTSFSFNEEQFHCFSCGASGDVISLVQALYSTDFRGALEIISGRSGTGHRAEYCKLHNKAISREEPQELRLIKAKLRALQVYEERLLSQMVRLRQQNLDPDTATAESYTCELVIEEELQALDIRITKLQRELKRVRGKV